MLQEGNKRDAGKGSGGGGGGGGVENTEKKT